MFDWINALYADGQITGMIVVILINQIKFAWGFVTLNFKYYFIIKTVKGARIKLKFRI